METTTTNHLHLNLPIQATTSTSMNTPQNITLPEVLGQLIMIPARASNTPYYVLIPSSNCFQSQQLSPPQNGQSGQQNVFNNWSRQQRQDDLDDKSSSQNE